MSALSRQYGISRKTAYKWRNRFDEDGEAGLAERSRRPHTMPQRTPAEVEEAVLAVRAAHPAWGGRKIAKVLVRTQPLCGPATVPSPSTITAILRRHGALDPEESAKHRPCQRFAMSRPNQLWQMDFKGYFSLVDRSQCHPLTVLDDCSRFLLGLIACVDEERSTVQASLTALFRCYGLPDRILADNGSPWGFGPTLTPAPGRPHYTRLAVWLLRLGIPLSHGRICHPQTQGKDERLHRTLNAELLRGSSFADLAACQCAFDGWRAEYNSERPHEALALDVPAAHYTASLRPFPEQLPSLVYEEGATLRTIDASGRLCFANRRFRIGKAFGGEVVAVSEGAHDGEYVVYFGSHPVYELRLTDPVPTGP